MPLMWLSTEHGLLLGDLYILLFLHKKKKQVIDTGKKKMKKLKYYGEPIKSTKINLLYTYVIILNYTYYDTLHGRLIFFGKYMQSLKFIFKLFSNDQILYP